MPLGAYPNSIVEQKVSGCCRASRINGNRTGTLSRKIPMSPTRTFPAVVDAPPPEVSNFKPSVVVKSALLTSIELELVVAPVGLVKNARTPLNALRIVPIKVIPVPEVPSTSNDGFAWPLKLRSPSFFAELAALVSMDSESR